MPSPNEDAACYVSPVQKEVLRGLLEHPLVENGFFLTGGTALSVFYLHHRVSNDIDLFSKVQRDLGEIKFWATRRWPDEAVVIREAPQFLSMLVRGTKVDIVVDPLSFDERRQRVKLENGHELALDTINGIASNKLGTVAGRREPKDFVDLFFIVKQFSELSLETLLCETRRKDALFDDPPTAAFQIEEGARYVASAGVAWPEMRRPFDRAELFEFYQKLARWLYGQVKIPN